VNPFLGDLDRRLDVGIQGTLVAAGQQHHDHRTALHEVNAIAGTVINPHFAHAFARRFHVVEMVVT
jgi:hypothetical protein